MPISKAAVAAFFGGVALTGACIGYCSLTPRPQKVKEIALGVLLATVIGAVIIGLTAFLGPRISTHLAKPSSWQTALKASGAWIRL